MMYLSFRRTAVVVIEPGSEPAPGSVRANAPRSDPSASPISHFSFCSGLPNLRSGSVERLATDMVTALDAHA